VVDFTEYDTRLAAYAAIVDDADCILLTWFNGGDHGTAEWTLPGGGVEYAETVEAAIVREVREETGYDVQLEAPLATHSFTLADGPRPPRPYKSVRIVYSASVTGGTLGTLEIGGTTDRAEWIPIRQVPNARPRADIVDVAIAALPPS
jgi:8-oxo-dGTP diphosphatase